MQIHAASRAQGTLLVVYSFAVHELGIAFRMHVVQ